jgi:hypothetical protein
MPLTRRLLEHKTHQPNMSHDPGAQVEQRDHGRQGLRYKERTEEKNLRCMEQRDSLCTLSGRA